MSDQTYRKNKKKIDFLNQSTIMAIFVYDLGLKWTIIGNLISDVEKFDRRSSEICDPENYLGDLHKELIGQKRKSTVSSIKGPCHVMCQDKIKMTTKVLLLKVSLHIFSEFT